MTTCSLCYSHTETDQQSYMISDLRPDLMTLLPERLQHEVLEESICSGCFEELLGSLHQRDTPVIFPQHDINSCVWCHRSLARRSGQQRRSRVFQSGPIHNFITTTTLRFLSMLEFVMCVGECCYAEGGTWEESIKQYYCSLICGKRTVGCCAHTMTIVWYLGWARHEENIEIPVAFLDGILIREDDEIVHEV